MYEWIDEGIPVVIWCTIGMTERAIQQGWYTEDGEYVDWAFNDHGAVLIGEEDDLVTIADPLDGIVEYGKKEFEQVFESRGNRCVIIQ